MYYGPIVAPQWVLSRPLSGKKKKILLLESRRMFFVVVVLFPQNAPSQLSCISSEITKKFTKNSQNKIHISEKLLEYQLWIRT